MNKCGFISNRPIRRCTACWKNMPKTITVVDPSEQPSEEVRQYILMIRSVQLSCLGSNPGFTSNKIYLSGQFN